MKKIFVFMSVLLLIPAICEAKSQSVIDLDKAQNIAKQTKKQANKQPRILRIKDINQYIVDRIESGVSAYEEDAVATNGNTYSSVQKPPAILEMEKAKQKSMFQNMYEKALAKVTNQPEQVQAPTDSPKTNTVIPQQRSIETISVYVSSLDQYIDVPAMEHIPYMFTQINILPYGMAKIDETIVVLANAQNLKNKLSRSLPYFIADRKNELKKSGFRLLEVSINGNKENYSLQKYANNFIVVPQDKNPINPGIYEYKFSYLTNRLINHYDDFDEIYWNLTNNSLNAVISAAAFSINFPADVKIISHSASVGFANKRFENLVAYSMDNENSIGFTSTRPLLPGESIYAFTSVAKSQTIKPTFAGKISWIIDDFGDMLFALLALIAIGISYMLSFKSIKNNESKTNIFLKKTPQMMRLIKHRVFDNVSFVASLMEICKKNVMKPSENPEISLIKTSDNLSALTSAEQKAVKALFPNQESFCLINDQNRLKLQRAFTAVKKDTLFRFRSFLLKLNFNYTAFATLMLLFAQGAVVAMETDKLLVFSALLIADTVSILLALMFFIKAGKKISIALKTLSLIISALMTIALSGFISLPASVLMVLCVWTIVYFTKMFAQHNVFYQNILKDVEDYCAFMAEKKLSEINERDFATNQSMLYALQINIDQLKQNTSNINMIALWDKIKEKCSF